VDSAYEFSRDITYRLTIGGKTKERAFKKRDQFAPELLYFSNCVLSGKDRAPCGEEGMAGVRIIEALYYSAQTGQPVRLSEFEPSRRAQPAQEIRRPAIRKPQLIHARSPSRATWPAAGNRRTFPTPQVWQEDLEAYIRKAPMKTLLIAAGAGIALGFLLRRR